MDRRTVLKATAGTTLLAASTRLVSAQPIRPLAPPAKGKIPVAVLISDGAQVIDFAGPWEVFQDVHVPSRGVTMDEMMPFQLFTIAATTRPVRVSGGLQIVPDHDFRSTPVPRVIVIPAQSDPTEATTQWLHESSKLADVTMSVCVGSFVLGKAGLLHGQVATTHHAFYDRFEKEFPDAQLKRDVRFVENDRISTAGGLTSGIDLALHVVERYYGYDIAQQTASYMEHESKRWMV